MNTRFRENQRTTAQGVSGSVVVEFEEPKFELEGYPVPPSWPLRLLQWFYLLGAAGGVGNLILICIASAGLLPPRLTIPLDLLPRAVVIVAMATASSGFIAWQLFRRRRAGAIAALLSLSLPFVRSVYLGHPHLSTLAFVAIGIVAVAWSWKELD